MVLTATVFAAFARAMLQALYAVGWGGGGMFIKAQNLLAAVWPLPRLHMA